MLVDAKIAGKIGTIEKTYQDLRFAVVQTLPAEMAVAREHYRHAPDHEALEWRAINAEHHWGESWQTCWFRTEVTIPAELDGRTVFVRAQTGAPETLLLIDGQHRGVFDVNHPVRLVALKAQGGRRHAIHLEAYAGHTLPGTQPFPVSWCTPVTVDPGCRVFKSIELVTERTDVSAFVFALRALSQLAANLDENSLRRGRLMKILEQVFTLVYAKPEEVPEEQWRAAIVEARSIMQPALDGKNSATAPMFGIVGHSHIDTAWQWPITETWRKCARTFSSILALMDQYPEFRFIQSAAYHADIIRKLYPDIFQRMQQRVREGRWEINGAMWIEPDCNIPSGESLVRQCLVGQAATREMFGVTSDTLWQPDVFGYSGALPQILKSAGVKYFCTTKIGWNDTNRFPYDTFIWRGIDGTPILSHFNLIHCWPDPETLIKSWNWVQHKDVQDRRLMAFGFGDGGGGPQSEMIEMARLTQDLEGCPRTQYTTVSDFMQGCENEMTALPTWVGELYLELHRGTLTSVAAIKRGNRRCEFALREAEFLASLASLRGASYPAAELLEQWKLLLLNQFHDILPGTSIAEVNDEACRTFDLCRQQSTALAEKAAGQLAGASGKNALFLSNSLSWNRTSELVLSGLPADMVPAEMGIVAQPIEDIGGTPKLAISGLELPALGYRVVPLGKITPAAASPFHVAGNSVVTPFARVELDDAGWIRSFTDTQSARELVTPGGRFNQFLLGEDVPAMYDNWDIDRDQRLKLKPAARLRSRKVVSNGPLQLRIRFEYALGQKSTLAQDVIFHAGSAQVDFETRIDWHEKYQFLKTAFALNVLADSARHEVQFGHVTRSAHDNTSEDRAQFDVCAHKWTDISETSYGVAFLNDCKYACTVKEGEYRLSLIKSGRHPDVRGDEGIHRFTYSLLPHASGFSVESVVRPAYELNLEPTAVLAGATDFSQNQLLQLDGSNVIVESVKRAESGSGVVLRMYEASKTGTHVRVTFKTPAKSVREINLLEENPQPLALEGQTVSLYFRPFEIKTLVCEMAADIAGK